MYSHREKYPNLFSPLRIKNVVFRNRAFAAPTQMSYIDGNNNATDYGIAYFAAKARGGAALVTVGDTPVDSRFAPALQRHFILDDPGTLPMLSELARAIKEQGAVAAIELNHCGQMSQPKYIGGRNPIGPVEFIRSDGIIVHAMNDETMDYTIESFSKAALFCKLAGFDMVTIHAGHGWLLSQFLSSLTNSRTDQYGGSLENRIKFPIEVIGAIRKAVGGEYLIELRISGTDKIKSTFKLDEMIFFVQKAEPLIDLVNVSSGVDTDSLSASICHPYIYSPHCQNADIAKKIKSEVNIPVVTVGSVMTPVEAEQIISDDFADAVAFCRAFIADPDFIYKTSENLEDEITPCIRCLSCLGEMQRTKQFNCTVNPEAGHEYRLNKVQPKTTSRKIIIVGGGPAGIAASLSAAEHGHEIVLYEKGSLVGGLLKTALFDKYKQDTIRYLDYLIKRLRKYSNIEIITDFEFTASELKNLPHDYVIAATGSCQCLPDIPGIESDNVLNVSDIYSDDAETGQNIVVIGGGMSGCEAALYLLENGNRISIIDKHVRLLNGTNKIPRAALLNMLTRKVDIHLESECVEINSEKQNLKINDMAGNETTLIDADLVINASGRVNNFEYLNNLRIHSNRFIAIGDCYQPGNLLQAIHAGYFAGRNLR